MNFLLYLLCRHNELSHWIVKSAKVLFKYVFKKILWSFTPRSYYTPLSRLRLITIAVFIIKEYIYFSCTMAILSYSSCEWSWMHHSCFTRGKTKKDIFSDLFKYETHMYITIYGVSVLSMTINFISTYFPLQHSNPNQHRWHS